MLHDIEIDRDPLRIEALPAELATELDYRARTADSAGAVRLLRYRMRSAVAVAIPVAVSFRLVGEYVTAPIWLALFTLIGFVLGVVSYFRASSGPYSVLFWSASGPTVWGLAVVTRAENLLLLVLVAMLFVSYLIHLMVAHYSTYANADIQLDRTTRRWWDAQWWGGTMLESECREGLLDKARLQALVRQSSVEAREKRWYLGSHLAVPCAYVLAAVERLGPSPRTMVTPAISPVFYEAET